MDVKGPMFVPPEKSNIIKRMFGLTDELSALLRKRSNAAQTDEIVRKKREESEEGMQDERTRGV